MAEQKAAAAKRADATIDTPDALNRETFTISDLSAEFDVTARALRFYEDQGLIAPERQGLSRIYSKRDRARLAWILRAKRVGFRLSEIRPAQGHNHEMSRPYRAVEKAAPRSGQCHCRID